MRRLLLSGLVLVAALAAGCGSGDDDTATPEGADEKAAAARLDRFLTSASNTVSCDNFSPRLLQTIYGGGQDKCRQAEADTGSEAGAKDVELRKIDLTGDRATLAVTLKGGDYDNVQGTFTLTRNGSAWLVDGLGGDFLRASIVRELQDDSDLPKDGEFRGCITDKLDGIPDTRLQELIYGIIGEREAPDGSLSEVAAACFGSTDSGKKYLRDNFEKGIFEGATEKDISQDKRDCITDRLDKTVTDRELLDASRAQASGDTGSSATLKVRQSIRQAAQACGVT